MNSQVERTATSLRYPLTRKPCAFFICILVIFLIGCQPGSNSTPPSQDGEPEVSETPGIVPTIAPIFIEQLRTPTSSTPVFQSSATPLPTETLSNEERQRGINTEIVSIYSNGLNPDWEIVQNTEVLVSETGRPKTYEGRLALQVTPLQDFGQLIFRVKPDAQNYYLRSKILALIIWISGGPNYIDTDDLAVTVLGSDRYPYWVADDRSVYDGPDSPFSETRLYYLGLNNAIPPDTWAEAINWLDDRQFDPDYRYVTGFYIKNDEGFEYAYYVDEISLLMIADQTESTPTQIITPTPTGLITPTPTKIN